MLTPLLVLLRSIGSICRGHRAVALENLALRQQLAALTRTTRCPQPYEGPTLLDPSRQGVAGVAHRHHDRAARDRGAVAPPVASSSVDVALDTDTSGAAHHGCDRSNARRQDGRGESAVGSASDSRRIVHAGHRGLGADRVAAPPATTPPPVADVADLLTNHVATLVSGP